jgi:hypothetical protein
MNTEKFGIVTFFKSVSRDLSLIGKFAAFFSTLLLVPCILYFNTVRFLLGLALLFLTLSNYYWQERSLGVSAPDYEDFVNPRPWYLKVHWKLIFLSGLFFIFFVIVMYLFFELSEVQNFLKTIEVF